MKDIIETRSKYAYERDFHYAFKGSMLDRRQSLTVDSPVKTMKNAFYFISKAVFFLEIFTILYDFLVVKKNGLIRKL